MGFISSISSILGGSSRENKKKKPNIAEENEIAYNKAKKDFDHFFDDEKLVEIKSDFEQDD